MLFTKNHEWIEIENGVATVGITDFAQEAMGEIVYVELPEVDDEISKDDVLGVVESVKAASDVFSPITGTVIEVNEELEDAPELVNEKPYEAFLIKVKLEEDYDTSSYMDEEAYTSYCESAEEE